jgi:hypothetical protein
MKSGRLVLFWNQLGWHSSIALGSYLESVQFESWPRYHLSWLWFLMVFLSPFKKWQYCTSIRSQPLPSKSFPVHPLSYHSKPHSTVNKAFPAHTVWFLNTTKGKFFMTWICLGFAFIWYCFHYLNCCNTQLQPQLYIPVMPWTFWTEGAWCWMMFSCTPNKQHHQLLTKNSCCQPGDGPSNITKNI